MGNAAPISCLRCLARSLIKRFPFAGLAIAILSPVPRAAWAQTGESHVRLVHSEPVPEGAGDYIFQAQAISSSGIMAGFIIYPNRVECFANGNVIKTIQAGPTTQIDDTSVYRVIYNDSHSHFAVIKQDYYDASLGRWEVRPGTISVYNTGCDLQWTRGQATDWSYYLSPNGKIVAGDDGGIRNPDLYSPEAKITGRVPTDAHWQFNGFHSIVFSEDSTRIVATSAGVDLGASGKASGVILYDTHGKELWRSEIMWVGRAFMSPDGRTIVSHGTPNASDRSYGVFSLSAEEGVVAWSRSQTKACEFTDSGKNLLLRTFTSNSSSIEIVDALTGNVKWEWGIPKTNVLDAQYDVAHGRLLVTLGIWAGIKNNLYDFTAQRLVLIDQKTRKTWEKDFPLGSLREYGRLGSFMRTGVFFDLEFKRFAIVTKTSIEVYEIRS